MVFFVENTTHPIDLRYVMKIRLLIFALVSVGALAFSVTIPSLESVRIAYFNFAYLNIALLTALATLVLLQHEKNRFTSWIRNRDTQVLLLTCLLATAFLYTREGGGFKIAFDEQVITTVSKSLHETHVPAISESPLIGFSRLEHLGKRPLLFPFILSLVHDTLGYRSSNGFYLNAALTFLFLVLLTAIIVKVSSRRNAYIAIILCCFTPLIAQNSSGAGFELLNLCCILLVACFTMDFWSKPNARTAGKLAFAGALASQVRYESVIIVIPIAITLIAMWVRKKKIILPWNACLIPIFFIPMVWQQRAVSETPESFQYSIENNSLFSLDHLALNLDGAFRFFFIPSNLYAGSPFIGFLGLAGLLLFAGLSLTRTKEVYANKPERVAPLFLLFYLIPVTTLHSFFYFGQYDNPIVSRLSLPLLTAFIITGALLIGFVYRKNKTARYICIGFMISAGLYASKQYANPKYRDTNYIHARSEWALDFAHQLPAGKYLFISTMPLVFEIENLNAIHSVRARADLKKLKRQIEFKTYREIFVIENFQLDYLNGELAASHLPRNHLGNAVKLELLSEASFALYNFSRISRIDDINLDEENIFGDELVPLKNRANGTQFKTPSPEEIIFWRESLL